jgi:hypothetical protein
MLINGYFWAATAPLTRLIPLQNFAKFANFPRDF